MLDRLLNLIRRPAAPPTEAPEALLPVSQRASAEWRRVRNEEWRRLYESGLTLDQIGKRYGMSGRGVVQVLVGMGVKMRPRGMRPGTRTKVTRAKPDIKERNQEWKRLYEEEGLTSGQIAKRYGRHATLVAQALRSVGAAMRPRKNTDPQRDAEIVRLRVEEHLALDEIGERFGFSRERARQIIVRSGVDPREAAHARRLIVAQKYKPPKMKQCHVCGEDYAPGSWRAHFEKTRHWATRNDDLDAALAADYAAGMTHKDIRAKHGVEATAIMRAVRRKGIPKRKPGFKKLPNAQAQARKQAIIADLRSGMRALEVASKYGVSDAWVYMVGREQGVHASRRRAS